MPNALLESALMLRVIAWLVEHHHQSLGLWPWTWRGPAGEPYVTLYASCTAQRFGDDFAALASWVDANRWPPLDGTPYPATFYRDRLASPEWALGAPLTEPAPAAGSRALMPDLAALARAGASIETLAQLLEANSNLDQYLATQAPLRHGSHPHRQAAGAMAVVVMRLATEATLALGEEYAIPWTGPTGGRPAGQSDPNWADFARRYHLPELPFPPQAHLVFTLGARGWLHADGWAGDRWGNVLRLGSDALAPAAFAQARALILCLLGNAA